MGVTRDAALARWTGWRLSPGNHFFTLRAQLSSPGREYFMAAGLVRQARCRSAGPGESVAPSVAINIGGRANAEIVEINIAAMGGWLR